jgi:hypothetical protein
MKAHHVILLPGDSDPVNFKDAQAFADKAGGYLPTRREQSLLFANLKEQFQQSWYWSGEVHESGSGYAWCQGFYDGSQDYYGKDLKFRVRAVRRVSI